VSQNQSEFLFFFFIDSAILLRYIDLNMITKYAYFSHHHHHQPINVPTAGAQAFLMDYPQGERAITHLAGPVRIGGILVFVILVGYHPLVHINSL
jgi:hypothetical protein